MAVTRDSIEKRAKELGFTATLTPTIRAAIWSALLEEDWLEMQRVYYEAITPKTA